MSTSSPSSLGYDLLPPDSGAISPDLALNAALAPVVDLNDPTPIPFGKGWQFDFNAGQFIRVGAAPAEAYDLINLQVWIEKTLLTAKFAHPIYTDSYGMDDPFGPIGFISQSDLLGEYQQQITAALTVHDRILNVNHFNFAQASLDDAIYVTFTVVLDGENDDSNTVTVSSLPLLTGPSS